MNCAGALERDPPRVTGVLHRSLALVGKAPSMTANASRSGRLSPAPLTLEKLPSPVRR